MKEYKYRINGSLYNVTVNNVVDETADVEVNGIPYTVELEKKPKKQASSPFKKSAQLGTQSPGVSLPPAPKKVVASSANALVSPLPGVILEISCKVGDSVKKGQKILILEAMKMENNIIADKDGIVEEIKVNKGDSVLEGTELAVIVG